MSYESTLKQFHKYKKEEFETIFKRKYNAPDTLHFNLNVGGHPAFFYFCYDIYKKIILIYSLTLEIYKIQNSLSELEKSFYIKNCLYNELVSTNNIENIDSSKEQIVVLTEKKKVSDVDKLISIIKSYNLLLESKLQTVESCEDISNLYKEFFIELNDKDYIVDGNLFRKSPVGVYKLTDNDPIHKGASNEEEITTILKESLTIINNKDLELSIRIALFHFFFEHAHPFYDGNGRIGRYLMSYFYKNEDNEIFAFNISSFINKNKSKYYKLFENTEHPNNRGDLTTFVDGLLDITIDGTNQEISNIKKSIELKEEYLNKNNDIISSLNKGELSVFNYVLANSMFDDIGVSLNNIINNLNISERNLRRIIKSLIDQNIVVVNHIKNKQFYLINL